MPRINGNNSSNEGGNNGKSRSVAKGMKGIRLAKRLPHKNKAYDATLSQRPKSFGGAVSSTNITSTGSQTYTVPEGVDTVTLTMYGGGGGGGIAEAAGKGTNNGKGGGSGSRIVLTINEIAPGTVLTFNVGAGGAAGSGSANGSVGGDTTLTYGGVTYTAGGGYGGNSSGVLPNLVGLPGNGGGGVAERSGGAEGTLTNGNNKSAHTGGAALGDSAGAGGNGSTSASSQNNTAGGNGKVIIS